MHEKQNLGSETIKQRSIQSLVVMMVRVGIIQAVVFTATIFVSRFLEPEVFGVYGVVANFVFLFVYFSDVGLAASLVQKKSEPTRKELITVFTIQQALVGLIVTFIWLFLPYVSKYLSFGKQGILLGRALSISLFLASLKSVPSLRLERNLRFTRLAVVEVLESIVFNSALVFFAWRGFGVATFSWAVLLRGAVGLAAVYLFSPFKIGFGIDGQVLRELARFGLPFQVNTILAWVKDNLLDNAVALLLRSPQEFGYLSWGRNMAFQPKKIMDMVSRVAFPAYSRIQERREVLGSAAKKSLFLLSISVFPIIFAIVAFIRPMIDVLYGGQKWYPAVWVVYLMSFNLFWAVICSVFINILQAVGEIRVVFRYMVGLTIVSWVLIPVLVIYFGYLGAPIGWAITSLASIWCINKGLRVVKFAWVREILPGLMASFAALLAVLLLRQLRPCRTAGGLVFQGGVYIFSYFLFLWLGAREKIIKELKILLEAAPGFKIGAIFKFFKKS